MIFWTKIRWLIPPPRKSLIWQPEIMLSVTARKRLEVGICWPLKTQPRLSLKVILHLTVRIKSWLLKMGQSLIWPDIPPVIIPLPVRLIMTERLCLHIKMTGLMMWPRFMEIIKLIKMRKWTLMSIRLIMWRICWKLRAMLRVKPMSCSMRLVRNARARW